MRKSTMTMAPAMVLALALAASAQEKPITTKKDMTDTIKVNVSGNVVMDYIYRGREIVSVISNTNDEDSTNTFEGEIGVRFDVEMSDKVALVVEIGRERVDDFGGGLANRDRFGESSAEDIVLRELRVMIGDFLTPGMQFQVGIPDWEFNVRGKGGSFAFAPRRSESAFNNVSANEDGAGSMAARAGDSNELDPVGFVFRYVREQLTLDVVLLPAVLEGGEMSDDEALYAFDIFYSLDNKGSRIAGILALMASPDSPSSMFTLGGGLVWNGIESLELFAEIYFQFGDVGTVGADEIDAGGFAFRVGGMWTAQDGAFSVGVMIDFRSGDGDDGTDDTVDSFISYEAVNDLLILEDQYFGLDWDTNSLIFKFMAELPLQIKAKNDLVLSAILGIAQTVEDVQFASGENALGNELDVRARWNVTKQAGLQAAIALLFGSDIMEEEIGGGAADESDDGSIMYTLGADLRF
jgi:hypothetical protein